MKKTLFCLTLCLMFGVITSVGATEKPNDPQSINWEISMMPKQTEEEIALARWSVVVENDMGVYAYDMESLFFEPIKNGTVDDKLVNVVVKTVFTDKNLVKKLNNTYVDKLLKKEKIQYCEMLMLFNIVEKTYCVKQMDVYGNKGTKVDSKINDVKLVPVESKTFAEAMLEICVEAAKNTKEK